MHLKLKSFKNIRILNYWDGIILQNEIESDNIISPCFKEYFYFSFQNWKFLKIFKNA